MFHHVGLFELKERIHGKRYYVAALPPLGRSRHYMSDEDAEKFKARKDDPVRRNGVAVTGPGT